MHTQLSPAVRPGGLSPAGVPRYTFGLLCNAGIRSSFSSLSLTSSLPSCMFSTLSTSPAISLSSLSGPTRQLFFPPIASASVSAAFSDDSEQVKLDQVARRLAGTARYFNKLGSFGFWSQLICTVVAAVVLSFSVVVTGKILSPITFYSTAASISAAFISVFWSFGYLRLSERLRRTVKDPSKAPPRADVVKSLKNGIILNIAGMGAAILGLQASVGLLVAKALTTSATPYQSVSTGNSPVLALDIFLVQASANTILSHFLGLISSLELLRSVTSPSAGPKIA